MVACVTADSSLWLWKHQQNPAEETTRTTKRTFLPVIIAQHNFLDCFTEDTSVFLFICSVGQGCHVKKPVKMSPLLKIWAFYTIYGQTAWLRLQNACDVSKECHAIHFNKMVSKTRTYSWQRYKKLVRGKSDLAMLWYCEGCSDHSPVKTILHPPITAELSGKRVVFWVARRLQCSANVIFISW